MGDKRVYFRPHHFLCTLSFQGNGYSDDFVSNFQNIKEDLQDDETVIEVVRRTDSICASCPHQRGALCESQAKIERLDDAHATALNLKAGDRLTWSEAIERIRDSISLEVHQTICQGCEWLPSGICAKAILALNHHKGESYD